MIERIYIKNFKRIEEVDIQLDKINLVTGPNNSGKTSLLQAVMIAYDALIKIVDIDAKRNIKFSFTSQGGIGKLLLHKDISFYVQNTYEVIKNKSKKHPAEFIIYFSNDFVFSFKIDDAPHFIRVVVDNSDELKTGIYNSQIDEILRHPPLYIPSFTGIDSHEHYMHLGQIRSLISKGHASHTLKNLLYLLSKDINKMSVLIRFLQAQFGSNFNGFIIDSDPLKEEAISVKYKLGRANYELSTIGSGFLQLTGILALALFFDGSDILLLDEPDAHLHSSLQSTLLELLRNLGKGEFTLPKQVVVATHSLDLINSTDPRNIYYVQNGKCLSNTTDQQKIEELLNDLGAGNFEFIKARNYSRLLFTEDKEDFDRILLSAKQLGYSWAKHFGHF